MMVDDDLHFVESCASLLRAARRGDVVVAAFSVGEALERMEQSRFDAVITDYLFGHDHYFDDRTGVDLLSIIAARFPTTRRMLFSGAVIPEQVDAHIVLDKVAGVAALLDCVDRLLGPRPTSP
jgi:DNA-binding NarL/FixJ family response regulator